MGVLLSLEDSILSAVIFAVVSALDWTILRLPRSVALGYSILLWCNAATPRGEVWVEICLDRLARLCQKWYPMSNGEQPKPLFWVGSSKKDLKCFPLEIRRTMGFALFQAQTGGKHVDAKPLKGYGGAGVLEVVEDHQGDAFRAVYTVKFAGAVYVLHAFQKKSKKGIATPKAEVDLIRRRLTAAEKHYGEWRASQAQEEGDKSGAGS